MKMRNNLRELQKIKQFSKKIIKEQAGAELGKAQPKLGLGRIKALAKSRKVVWD